MVDQGVIPARLSRRFDVFLITKLAKRIGSWTRPDEISPNLPSGAKSFFLSRVFLSFNTPAFTVRGVQSSTTLIVVPDLFHHGIEFVAPSNDWVMGPVGRDTSQSHVWCEVFPTFASLLVF